MRVWIDIDNSPHVPFFLPIMDELKRRGHEIVVSSREYAQTIALLQKYNIPFIEVGEHAGKNKLKKLLNLADRSIRLVKVLREFKPDVAVSHGSRAQTVAAKMMGVPKLVMFDYEWNETYLFRYLATLMACPHILSDQVLQQVGLPIKKIYKYKGFKEDVYLPTFSPDPYFRKSLDISEDTIFVVIRPSSMTSNYHDSKSEKILLELLKKFISEPSALGFVVPRTQVDKDLVNQVVQKYGLKNIRIADKALPGLQLLYWADIVISGGGTMNREAALLGTPTFSIFTGPRPAIDEYLKNNGQLTFIETPEQVNSIPFRKNLRNHEFGSQKNRLVEEISDLIEKISGKRV